MAKAQDVSWPPSNGLRTVNVSRQEVVLTSSGSTRINAPAALVFATLLNVGEYGKWNTWVPKVTIEAQPCENLDVSQANKLHLGTNFTFLVIMDSSKPDKETPTQLKVTDISTPDNQSGYISKEALEREASFTADLSKVYRVAWKCEVHTLVTPDYISERYANTQNRAALPREGSRLRDFMKSSC